MQGVVKPTAKSLSVVMQKVCQDSQLYVGSRRTLEQGRRSIGTLRVGHTWMFQNSTIGKTSSIR